MNLGTLIGLVLGTSLIGLAAFLSATATGISLLALYDTVSSVSYTHLRAHET